MLSVGWHVSPTFDDLLNEVIQHFDKDHLYLPYSWSELRRMETEYVENQVMAVFLAGTMLSFASACYLHPKKTVILAPLFHVALGLVSCISSQQLVVGRVRMASGAAMVGLSFGTCVSHRWHSWSRREMLHYQFVHAVCFGGVAFYSLVVVAQCMDYLTITIFQAVILFVTGLMAFIETFN